MKRRTLDVAFSIGGMVFSVLLLVVGLILNNQKSFAEDYVRTELTAQKINFTPAKFLSDEEKQAPCLVEYGTTAGDATKGQVLDSGKKAECYASSYIALHMQESATAAGYEGATYATMGAYVRPGSDVSLVDALTAAQESGDQAKIDEAQKALDGAKGLRSTLQTGETLRGLLLTTYGFSIFGERAGQAAWVTIIAALVLFVLSIAGFVHAFASKKADDVVLAVEHHRETVGV
ncbi:MAG: hypothetical protein KGR47_02695 [Acidobacteria bacterium]|nr:hypothetical protein [Acidobacteriota bacterium]